MKITKLILHKYKRLFLNNITTLVYTPDSDIQLILGSNGSGKSSLLSVLNPLPIDIKKRFNEGGYAEITIVKDNKTFILTSGLEGKAGKYSFKVDDIERNNGGTRKAQLQLVEEYFRLTPKMNEIVLGTKTLTNMSTVDRKEWFRHMSTVDYGYSISMFNKLKSRLRDVSGGIKLLNTEITKDTELLLDNKDVSEYETHRMHIKDAIESLMFKYNHNVKDVNCVLDNIKIITNKLESLYSDKHSQYTQDDLKVTISSLKNNILIIDKDLDITNKDLDKIEYIEKNDVDEDKINNNLNIINNTLSEIDKYLLNIDIDKSTLDVISNSFNLLYSDLISVTNDLAPYDSIEILKDTYQNILNKVNSLKNDIKIKTSRVITYKDELKRLKDSLTDDNKIVCSNCATVSYFGYDKKRIETIQEQLELLNKDIDKLKSAHLKESDLLGTIGSKVDILKKLQTIIKNNDSLYSVWSLIFKNETIGVIKSYNLLMKIEEVKVLLDKTSDYPKLSKQKIELENKLSILKEVNKVKEDLAIKSKEELLLKVSTLTNKKRMLLQEISELERLLKELDGINILESKLRELLTISKHNRLNEIEDIKNRGIKDLVYILKNDLVEIEEKIAGNTRVSNKIDNNKKLLEDYKLRQKVLARTVKALSPTEGLIAKSINSFINKILYEINTIINEVWSYEMTLLPCEISDDNDLDYLFKVQVDNREIIDDVSDLSSSMKEIVNLAFKIVFMKYSKLDYMPLILDEFGVTMDSKHRHSAYNVIDNILCSNFNQIFITAHFQSIYTRFVNADINVLDDKNIELSSSTVVNEKIKIT